MIDDSAVDHGRSGGGSSSSASSSSSSAAGTATAVAATGLSSIDQIIRLIAHAIVRDSLGQSKIVDPSSGRIVTLAMVLDKLLERVIVPARALDEVSLRVTLCCLLSLLLAAVVCCYCF